MKTAIILAASSKPGETRSFDESFLIHGRPLLDWTIRNLDQSGIVDDIYVIGPPEIESLLCFRRVRRRISGLAAFTELLTASKSEPADDRAAEEGFIVIFSEAVLVSPERLSTCWERFPEYGKPIGIPYHRGVRLEPEAPVSAGGGHIPVRSAVFAMCAASSRVADAAGLLYKQHPEKTGSFQDFLIDLFRAGAPAEELCEWIPVDDEGVSFLVSDEPSKRSAATRLAAPRPAVRGRSALLYNPEAGKGMRGNWFMRRVLGMRQSPREKALSPQETTERITGILRGLGIDAEPIGTESPADSAEKARRCAKLGYELVIAAGGDGAVNSVINGIAGTGTILGIIPMGTANVFAIQMDIPADIGAACQLIADGTPRFIDLGKINDRYFGAVAGVGFDAHVIQKADSSFLKKMFGGAGYALQGLVSFFSYPFRPIHFTIDDGSRHTAYFILVGNGKYYGGNWEIAPGAVLDDGKLDVVVFTGRRLHDAVLYLRGIYKGELWKYAEVEYLQPRWIEIERSGRQIMEADGEISGRTPARIEAVPKALGVIC